MKVLHLCSAYVLSNLYRELIEAIDKLKINQTVYIPIKRKEDLNKNIVDNLRNTNFIYSKAFNNIDRLLYSYKVNKILKDIKNKVDFKNIDPVHAHFLFSMGGIALKLKREKNIDYAVSVRNSDVNVFFKNIFYLRRIGIQIMKEAKKSLRELYME